MGDAPHNPSRSSPRFIYRRPRRGPLVQVFDPAGFEWNIVELTVPALPPRLDGARLVHLTDMHLRSRWTPGLENLVTRLNREPPDLLLFTGDFVDDKYDHGPALPTLRRLVTHVHATFGTYAILGNHDGDFIGPRLVNMCVRVITHERVLAPVRGEHIELIGFPGPDRTDLDESFLHGQPAKTPGVPRVILSHYPDLVRAAQAAGLGADLFLAGHTHGGQICLPGGMPIITHDSLPRAKCHGVHDFAGTCLVVSRGMGFSTLPIRAFCPAEVVEIVLRETMKSER